MAVSLAPDFCQVAWVVKDIEATEKFFTETMGVNKFLHFDNLAATDTNGTYLGKPGRLGRSHPSGVRRRYPNRAHPARVGKKHLRRVPGPTWRRRATRRLLAGRVRV